MVPADSDRIPRVPPYSGLRPDHTLYVYGTFTLFGRIFQTIPLSVLLITTTLQPRRCLNSIGLGYSHFARHYSGNHYCFLFLRVLRCFSSPGWRPASRNGTRCVPGCPIRTSADLRVFAPLRGFSQLVTSFFASESQGILHAPFSPFLFSFLGKSPFFAPVRP